MSRAASPTKARSILLAAVRKLIRRPLSRLTSLMSKSGSRNCVSRPRMEGGGLRDFESAPVPSTNERHRERARVRND